LTLRGDFKGVSRERGVERGPYHWSKVPHEMGVEREVTCCYHISQVPRKRVLKISFY
jgi:hypothetical protein